MTPARDASALVARMPYARYLGVQVVSAQTPFRIAMPFAGHLVGNTSLQALHGGAVASIIEIAAQLAVMQATGSRVPPETIDARVDYLRSGKPETAHADVEIVRIGRRVANLRVTAWQDGPSRPFATGSVTCLVPSG